jgi:hypothetical protein
MINPRQLREALQFKLNDRLKLLNVKPKIFVILPVVDE